MKSSPDAGALIEDYVARGVFRAATERSGKDHCRQWQIVWFRDQRMELEVDTRRHQARIHDVLPAIAPRSKLDRALRAWLKSREAPELPAHRRLDPAQLETALRNAAGCMQLGIRSRSGDTVTATRKLLHLVNELYLDFLAAPERYDWIVETFDLDPDNPHWP